METRTKRSGQSRGGKRRAGEPRPREEQHTAMNRRRAGEGQQRKKKSGKLAKDWLSRNLQPSKAGTGSL